MKSTLIKKVNIVSYFGKRVIYSVFFELPQEESHPNEIFTEIHVGCSMVRFWHMHYRNAYWNHQNPENRKIFSVWASASEIRDLLLYRDSRKLPWPQVPFSRNHVPQLLDQQRRRRTISQINALEFYQVTAEHTSSISILSAPLQRGPARVSQTITKVQYLHNCVLEEIRTIAE